MTTQHQQRSTLAATRAWVRAHIVLIVFGVGTVFALAVAVAESVIGGGFFPLVFFLILAAFIVPGVLRIDRVWHRTHSTP